ncbi:MAG: hypothetical protein ACYS9C_12775 [Planctomycetota bacterium]|jgi:hypothetical protein
MGEDNKEKTDNLTKAQRMALVNMHKTLLEALIHREQDIFRFLAILAPALGGFTWLIRFDSGCEGKSFAFIVGTAGVLLLLLTGAVYSLALGYNFRKITFQLSKMESGLCLDISQYILNKWKVEKVGLLKEYGTYCTPPEIIKVFWLAFILAIIGVTLSAYMWVSNNNSDYVVEEFDSLLIVWGVFCLIISLIAPFYYGCEIKKLACKEPNSWEKEEKSQ